MFYNSKISKIFLLRKDIANKLNTRIILENINISSKDSSFFILKGNNGSGKTNLINKLNYLFFKININNSINKFMLFFNLYNNLYLNIFKYKLLFLIKNKINLLSYGYIKTIYFISNYLIKKKIFLFDEPYNGLDKYLLTYINHYLKNIKTIHCIQLRAYHNILRSNQYIFIFLD